jgi:hypothetical protein
LMFWIVCDELCNKEEINHDSQTLS